MSKKVLKDWIKIVKSGKYNNKTDNYCVNNGKTRSLPGLLCLLHSISQNELVWEKRGEEQYYGKSSYWWHHDLFREVSNFVSVADSTLEDYLVPKSKLGERTKLEFSYDVYFGSLIRRIGIKFPPKIAAEEMESLFKNLGWL